MKTMLMMVLASVLCGCPLTVVDKPPCRACREECDDSGCDECRAEHCPDMAPSSGPMSGLASSDMRDRS